MRMSDPVDTETMKVCEAADDKVPSIRDNATKSEVADQDQSSKDEHGSNNNNKRDIQVKINKKEMYTLKSSHAFKSSQ